ncbi:MAG: hypothetical protein M3R54_01235 [Chloroflexota bacterium]|nr:hypothetical protein [Chloroflexota bacterium]
MARASRAEPAAGHPWLRQLRADHLLLTRRASTRRLDGPLARAAPRLADSRYAEELDRILEFASSAQDPHVALALGRRALMRDRPDDALRWLVQAQSLVGRRDEPAVLARIAFLLGGIYISRNESAAADAVLAWAEGVLGRQATTSADVVHLRALIADSRGERGAALALYREVLQRADGALTPMTRVLALRNLAETTAHSAPHESASLYGLALAVLDANELDGATRCTIDNGMGYALLCTGDLAGARLKLTQALSDARRVRTQRVQLHSRFNLTIADELGGALDAAQAGLRELESDARRHGDASLARWCLIRSAWLRYRADAGAEAEAILREAFPATPPDAYRDAITTLRSILRLDTRRASARADLVKLASLYRERGDSLTDFTLTLWIAYADAAAGRVSAARTHVARACALGAEGGFRTGTSWWSPDLVRVAKMHASARYADYVDRLVSPPGPSREPRERRVDITREGAVSIAGAPLAENIWRARRSGSGVLRRFFRALLSAHPVPLSRDELADLLWPDSEGDKAVRNLYTATKDLRTALVAVPGVRLEADEAGYRLVFAENVRIQ